MQTHPAAALRVFLAEDSAPIRERVSAALVAHEMQVVGEAATPSACIAGILASHPDVVVLDIRLDGGSGMEVLQAVRRRARHVGFVVLSNTTGAPYRKHYLAAGATGFLDKATEFEQLPAALEAASQQPTRH